MTCRPCVSVQVRLAGALARRLGVSYKEIVEIVNSPEMQEALKKQGVEPQTGTPDALAQRIRDDVQKWRDIIEKSGLRQK